MLLAKLFEEQVNKTPDELSIVSDKSKYTFRGLDGYANKVRDAILNEKIVNKANTDRVSLFFSHDCDMIAAMLGVLKSGNVYVPIDPSYPESRILQILINSESQVVLTDNKNYEKYKKIQNTLETQKNIKTRIINIESLDEIQNLDNHDLKLESSEEQLGYILYTSGSTGIPKGVIQKQKNIEHFITNYIKNLKITEYDRLTLFSSYCHDASVMDIYSALFSGATLYIINFKEIDNIRTLTDRLIKKQITIWHSVPTVFRTYIREGKDDERVYSVRYVVLGGEEVIPFDIHHFKPRFPNSVLYNLYGQTESSYNAGEFINSPEYEGELTIGEIVDDTDIFIMDEEGYEADVFEIGEIVIVNGGISPGYWKDDEKTSEVFIQDSEDERLYLTGDLGKILPNGKIKFEGRKDNLVKIRGYRVDIGEIETALLNNEYIDKAAVICKKDDISEKYLVAFVVIKDSIEIRQIRKYLNSKLPDYMIPAHFIELDEIPLTSTGKTNRKELMNIDIDEYLIDSDYEIILPRNEIEEKLIEIYIDILNLKKEIGIKENFFELGGHSLKATTLVSRIHKEFEVEVSIADILRYPTTEELSQVIKGLDNSVFRTIQPVEERDYYPMSASQRRMYILNQMNEEITNYNMARVMRLKGEFDISKIENIFNKLIERHESLRTSFIIVDGEIVQRIVKPSDVKFNVEVEDISALNLGNEEQKKQLKEKAEEFVRPFNLEDNCLLRVSVVKISKDDHLLMLDMHHIISDGVSMGVFVQEFVKLYAGKELEPLRIQYKDYAVWQNELLKTGKIDEQIQYWVQKFEGEIPVLDMPTDYKRPPIRSSKGDKKYFIINEEITKGLKDIANSTGATLYMVLLGALNALLHKYTGQEDIVIGSLIAGRPHTDLSNIIGMFVNNLAMRNFPKENKTFKEFLIEVKESSLEAYDNQDVQFEELIEKLPVKRDLSRNMIFDVLFVLHNTADNNLDLSLDGLEILPYEQESNLIKFDLAFEAFEIQDKISLHVKYSTNLYKENTINRFGRDFIEILEQIIKDTEVKLKEISIFTKEKERDLLLELNNTEVAYPEDKNTKQKTTLAISATFTSEPVEDYIKWWCRQYDINLEVKFAPYNQIFQELLSPESLISTNRDINLFMIRFEDWVRDISGDDNEKCLFIKQNYQKLVESIKNMDNNSTTIFAVFPFAHYLGLSQEVATYIERLTKEFTELVERDKSLVLLNLTTAKELYSTDEIFDPIKDKAGHMPFTDEYYAVMGTLIARKVCSLKRKPFKVIAVDCDNTIWGGVVGEDGVNGIEINESHIYLQNLLIQKQNEGMLIVLCSKNNERDVWEVFEKNHKMVLKKEHLSSWKINWQPKSKNLKELAEELNLGIDSFIFLDDSGVECYDVMMNNPEVLTLQVPKDSDELSMFLEHIWALDKDKVTEEDKVRTKRYQAEMKRKKVKANVNKLDDFLNELKLKVYINEVQLRQVPRISQLTQRTNQFNLSTIRRTEEDIKMLMDDPNVKCWAIEVEDRFGYYGLTGVVIMVRQGEKMFIDTLLLSCRVLGRKVEDALYAELCKFCYKEGIKTLETAFYPTAKNAMVEEYLVRVGFEKIKGDDSYRKYGVEIQPDMMSVDFVEVNHCARKFKEEVAVAVQESISLKAKINKSHTIKSEETKSKKYIKSKIMNWNTELHNEEELLHGKHILPLKNYTGEHLLKLPVQNSYESLAVVKKYVAPRNEVEEKLVEIFKDILNIDLKIGIKDNFFELGGHSLKAITLISKLYKEFNVQISLAKIFNAPTIEQISEIIKSSKVTIYDEIKVVGKKEYYPMSSVQERLYTVYQLNKKSLAYNMPKILKIEEEINKDRFKNAIKELIRRHDSLRTNFSIKDGQFIQKVKAFEDTKIDIEYYTATDEKDIEKISTNFIRTFDLEKDMPFRYGLMECSNDEYVLMFDTHHIVSDGTSNEILVKEFLKLYNRDELEKLKIQYVDFASWENKMLRENKWDTSKEYWKEVFEKEPEEIKLPYDYKLDKDNPDYQKADKLYWILEGELYNSLLDIATQNKGTLYMIMLTAINMVMGRFIDSEDIIIATPNIGRYHPQLEKIVGVFINMVPMRNYPSRELSLKEFLTQVIENTQKAMENAKYPYQRILDEVYVNRRNMGNSLFKVSYNHMNFFEGGIETTDLRSGSVVYQNETLKNEIDITTFKSDNRIMLELKYDKSLFTKEKMDNFLSNIITSLKAIATNVNTKFENIEFANLGTKNNSELIEDFNSELLESYYEKYGKGTIQSRLKEVFIKHADDTAIVFENQKYTYKTLDKKSDVIAKLLKDKGIENGEFIGVHLTDRVEILIMFIGILKARAVFAPLNPDFPNLRLENMIKSTNIKHILTSKDLEENLSNEIIKDIPCKVNVVDEDTYNVEDIESQWGTYSEKDEIYVCFTSGTTGIPKAMVGVNESLKSYIEWEAAHFKFDNNTIVSQVAAYSNDAYFKDVLVPLFVGGAVSIPPQKVARMSAESIVSWVDNSNINVLQCTPSLFNLINSDILNSNSYKNLKYVLLAGEPLSPESLKRWYKVFGDRVQIVNLYGASETTVLKTYYMVQPEDVNRVSIPIGKPIDGARVILLNDKGNICNVGEKGELFVRTPFMTNGYFNDKKLNDEKFVQNPFIESKDIIYKSGDYVVQLPDGNYVFKGRTDDQIKIRGNRVELSAISTLLLQHEHIDECVVVVREENNYKHICAYMTTSNEVDSSELRNYLKERLADYMIPSYFVILDEFKLNANNKIDKKTLPKPQRLSTSVDNYVAPRTKEEKLVENGWRKVLDIKESISVKENFFEIGGHSIIMLKLADYLKRTFELDELNLIDLYENPTIEEMTRFITSSDREDKIFYQLTRAKQPKTTIYAVPYVGGDASCYGALAMEFDRQNIGIKLMSTSIFDIGSEIDGEIMTIEKFAQIRANDIVEQISEQGEENIYLLGHCGGSIIAVAIADELKKLKIGIKGIIVSGFVPTREPNKIRVEAAKRMNFRQFVASLRSIGFADKLSVDVVKKYRNALLELTEYRYRRSKKLKNRIIKHRLKIYSIVADRDPETFNHKRGHKKWRKFANKVQHIVIESKSHYFISRNVDKVTLEISKIIETSNNNKKNSPKKDNDVDKKVLAKSTK